MLSAVVCPAQWCAYAQRSGVCMLSVVVCPAQWYVYEHIRRLLLRAQVCVGGCSEREHVRSCPRAQVAAARAEAKTAIERAEELAAEVMEKAQAEMARATLEARIGTVPEAALSQAMAQAQAKVRVHTWCYAQDVQTNDNLQCLGHRPRGRTLPGHGAGAGQGAGGCVLVHAHLCWAELLWVVVWGVGVWSKGRGAAPARLKPCGWPTCQACAEDLFCERCPARPCPCKAA